MKALRLTLLALACSAPLLASAQWQWLDDGGRKVFSDTPPPASVPANRILRQPGQRAPVADSAGGTVTTEAPAAGPVAAALPKLTGKETELEAKKKQAEAAEAEKKKAEAAKAAQVLAENCRNAKTGRAQLASGMRIARVNAKGEREIVDEKQRNEQLKQYDAIIGTDCKPPAQ